MSEVVIQTCNCEFLRLAIEQKQFHIHNGKPYSVQCIYNFCQECGKPLKIGEDTYVVPLWKVLPEDVTFDNEHDVSGKAAYFINETNKSINKLRRDFEKFKLKILE